MVTTRIRKATGGALSDIGEGGYTGQFLMKFGNNPEDYSWQYPPAGLNPFPRYNADAGDTYDTDDARFYAPVDLTDIALQIVEDGLVDIPDPQEPETETDWGFAISASSDRDKLIDISGGSYRTRTVHGTSTIYQTAYYPSEEESGNVLSGDDLLTYFLKFSERSSTAEWDFSLYVGLVEGWNSRLLNGVYVPILYLIVSPVPYEFSVPLYEIHGHYGPSVVDTGDDPLISGNTQINEVIDLRGTAILDLIFPTDLAENQATASTLTSGASSNAEWDAIADWLESRNPQNGVVHLTLDRDVVMRDTSDETIDFIPNQNDPVGRPINLPTSLVVHFEDGVKLTRDPIYSQIGFRGTGIFVQMDGDSGDGTQGYLDISCNTFPAFYPFPPTLDSQPLDSYLCILENGLVKLKEISVDYVQGWGEFTNDARANTYPSIVIGSDTCPSLVDSCNFDNVAMTTYGFGFSNIEYYRGTQTLRHYPARKYMVTRGTVVYNNPNASRGWFTRPYISWGNPSS